MPFRSGLTGCRRVDLAVDVKVRIIGGTAAERAMDDPEIKDGKAGSEQRDGDNGWRNHIMVPEAGEASSPLKPLASQWRLLKPRYDARNGRASRFLPGRSPILPTQNYVPS